MAKKPATAATTAKGVSPDDLAKFLKEAGRQKANASEYASSAGGYIKNQIERLKLHPKAVKKVMALHAMDEGQRQEFLRHFLDLSYKAGHFDQLDLFDDCVATLRAILARFEGSEGKRPPVDPALAEFPPADHLN